MTTTVGLWIDHRKAVVVNSANADAEIQIIESGVERQLRRGAGTSADDESKPGGRHGSRYESRRYQSQRGQTDDSRQRRMTGRLNTYYDAVIACVGEADAILIFGPGAAKGEFKARLEHDHPDGHIVGVESADQMTDGQIVAKVLRHFSGITLQ